MNATLPGRWPDQRFQIHPFVGYGSGRLFLAVCEIEFLDPICGIAKSVTNHDVFVKVLVAMAHAADIQRDLRLHLRQRGFYITVDLDMHRGLDGKIT